MADEAGTGTATADAGTQHGETQAAATQLEKSLSNGFTSFSSDIPTSHYVPSDAEKELTARNEQFAQSIPEQLRGEAWVKSILNTTGKSHSEEFFNQFANAQRLIGQKAQGLQVPGEGAPPEQVKAFHKALGVPDDVSQYKVEPAIKDGDDAALAKQMVESRPPEFMAEVYKAAQSAGITPKQLQTLFAANDAALIKHHKTQAAQQQQAAVADTDDFVNRMTAKWGDKADYVVSESKKLIESVLAPDSPSKAWLQNVNGTIPVNAALLALSEVTEGFRQKYLREDGGFAASRGQANNAVDPRLEARKLISHPAYHNERHPEHESVRAQQLEYLRQAKALGKL